MSNKIPALLVNDTSKTNNIGCLLTVKSLKSMLKQKFTFVDVINLNENLSVAANLQEKSRLRFIQKFSSFVRFTNEPKLVRFISKKYRNLLQHVDWVIINGEGTIHHDRLATTELISWILASKQHGKRVAVVNCTIQNLSQNSINILRENVDHLSVREPKSYEYLRQFRVRVTQAADAIFYDINDKVIVSTETQQNWVGYTPGVLSYDGIVTHATVEKHIRQLANSFEKVVYVSIEIEDREFESTAKNAGAVVWPLGFLNTDNAYSELSRFSLIVSGRYHCCLLALALGIDVLALSSNTWKISGFLKFGTDNPDIKVQRHKNELDLQNLVYSSTFDFNFLSQISKANIPLLLK